MIYIDIKYAEELDLSLNEIMCLYKIKYPDIYYQGINSDYIKLEAKKFIKCISNCLENETQREYILREKSKLLLDNMLNNCREKHSSIKKVTSRKVNNQVEENLETFRNKWKGLAPGSMGAKKSCKEKLTRWMHENPEYDFDDILKAVDIYINSFNGNFKYLQRADYFVFKKDGKEESSRLSAFIEEVGLENTDVDWTSVVN